MGYYVNNEYADPQLREAPPEKPIISQCAASSHSDVLIMPVSRLPCLASTLPNATALPCAQATATHKVHSSECVPQWHAGSRGRMHCALSLDSKSLHAALSLR